MGGEYVEMGSSQSQPVLSPKSDNAGVWRSMDSAPIGKRILTKSKHGCIEGEWTGEVCEAYYWRDMEWIGHGWMPVPGDGGEAVHEQVSQPIRDVLKDPTAVHLNMLRGGIAKPSPTNIGHLYRGEEAAEVVREVMRQNPDAFPPTKAPSREEVIEAIWMNSPVAYEDAGDAADAIITLFKGGEQ